MKFRYFSLYIHKLKNLFIIMIYIVQKSQNSKGRPQLPKTTQHQKEYPLRRKGYFLPYEKRFSF